MSQNNPYGPELHPYGENDPYPSFEGVADAEAREEGAQDARERGLDSRVGRLADWEKKTLDRGLDPSGTPFDAEPEEVDGPETPPSSPNDPQGGVEDGPYGAAEGSADAGTDPGPTGAYGTASVSGGVRRYGRIQVFFSNPALAMSDGRGSLARASMGSVWLGGTDECPDGFEFALQVMEEVFESLNDADGWIRMQVPLGDAEGHPGDPRTDTMIRAGAIDYMIVEEGAAPRVE